MKRLLLTLLAVIAFTGLSWAQDLYYTGHYTSKTDRNSMSMVPTALFPMMVRTLLAIMATCIGLSTALIAAVSANEQWS